ARTAFAHQRQRFAGGKIEADAAYHGFFRRIAAKTYRQIADRQQTGHAVLRWVRGSRMSRRASPNRLKPRMPSMMVRPGKTSSHGACCMRLRASLIISPSDGAGGW